MNFLLLYLLLLLFYTLLRLSTRSRVLRALILVIGMAAGGLIGLGFALSTGGKLPSRFSHQVDRGVDEYQRAGDVWRKRF